jgi:hypothetical protein
LFAQAAAPNGAQAIDGMSWQDFERLIGEAFRRRGYAVAATGGGGADGGVELMLTKGGEKSLVQCKHWRAQQVGVTVVRELYGVMAAPAPAPSVASATPPAASRWPPARFATHPWFSAWRAKAQTRASRSGAAATLLKPSAEAHGRSLSASNSDALVVQRIDAVHAAWMNEFHRPMLCPRSCGQSASCARSISSLD